MKILTARESKEIDNYAINEVKISGLTLMENAANAVSKLCAYKLQETNSNKVLVICGKGNNGGDGLAIGRILKNLDYSVKILILGDENEIKGDAYINLLKAKENNLTFIKINQAKEEISNADIVVDAIFGTGLSKIIEDPFKDIIEKINSFSNYIISVDIPSGIDGNTGEILGCCVKANETSTFTTPKKGHFFKGGIDNIGILHVEDIGIPNDILRKFDSNMYILTDSEAKRLLPKRTLRSNKGTYGNVIVIAGSIDMVGASYFVCKSSYRIGAGIVYALVPKDIKNTLHTLIPEVVTLPYQLSILNTNHANIIDKINSSNVLVIGPGLGTSKDMEEIIIKVLKKISITAIIDADALNNIVEHKEILKNMKQIPIITPHMGEMSRLTGIPIEEVLAKPIETAKYFAKEYRCITILKDYHTVIASPYGEVYINMTGNNSLSKAGSGDVLCGIIGGLLSQGSESYNAAILGVYIHGLLGDISKKKYTNYSVLASELIDLIPLALKNLL